MKKVIFTAALLCVTLFVPLSLYSQSQDFVMRETVLVGYNGSAEDVIIPEGVTAIESGAFFERRNLTSITIPSSVISIGESAFFNCRSLTSVTIPDSVTSIGNKAFVSCISLTNITIPASVAHIGNFAFDGCSSLTNIIVDTRNNEYSSIEGILFNKDRSILIKYPEGKQERSYNIPSSVAAVKYCAFWRCASLANITVDSQNTAYSSVDGILFNKDKTVLISYPAGKQEHTYTIPAGVISIDAGAFVYCLNLTSVTIPSSVTYIGESAFSECSGLTSITIPTSVTNIEQEAFSECTGLTSVTIPSSVVSVGAYAFEFCDNLRTVTVSRKATIGRDAFPATAQITYSD